MQAHNRLPGGLLAVVLAGPIFFASLAITDAAAKWPRPVAYSSQEIGAFLLMIIPGMVGGAILSFIPLVLGSLTMSGLGQVFPDMRSPMAWLLVGALTGFLIALVIDRSVASDGVGFALLATSALCARIARCWVRWGERPQPLRNAFTPAVAISA